MPFNADSQGQAYLLQGEAVAHDGPGVGGAAVLSNGLLGQVAHLHLLLHVPQHGAIHLQPLHTAQNNSYTHAPLQSVQRYNMIS